MTKSFRNFDEKEKRVRGEILFLFVAPQIFDLINFPQILYKQKIFCNRRWIIARLEKACTCVCRRNFPALDVKKHFNVTPLESKSYSTVMNERSQEENFDENFLRCDSEEKTTTCEKHAEKQNLRMIRERKIICWLWKAEREIPQIFSSHISDEKSYKIEWTIVKIVSILVDLRLLRN